MRGGSGGGGGRGISPKAYKDVRGERGSSKSVRTYIIFFNVFISLHIKGFSKVKAKYLPLVFFPDDV